MILNFCFDNKTEVFIYNIENHIKQIYFLDNRIVFKVCAIIKLAVQYVYR